MLNKVEIKDVLPNPVNLFHPYLLQGFDTNFAMDNMLKYLLYLV